jgi:hypothetical protein
MFGSDVLDFPPLLFSYVALCSRNGAFRHYLFNATQIQGVEIGTVNIFILRCVGGKKGNIQILSRFYRNDRK